MRELNNEHELRDSWSIVSEHFGILANQEKLIKQAQKMYKRQGRGVICLCTIHGVKSICYVPPQTILSMLDEGGFRERLLAAIEAYDPKNQVVALVTFNDVCRDEICHYDWYRFGLDKEYIKKL